MILRVMDVTKSFGRLKARNDVLQGVDAAFERGRHYAILGARGSGKSVLMKLLCGLETPTTGSIERRGPVSLPVGVIGLIANRRTPRGLIEYFAALYDGDPHEMANFVAGLAGLRGELDMELRSLDSGRKVRLNFALGYAIPAQVYLFDSLFAVGDASQRALFEKAFLARRKSAGTIFATSDTRIVERVADHAFVLRNGRLHTFSTVADAIAFHSESELSNPANIVARAALLARTGSMDKARAMLRDHLDRSEAAPEAYSLLADLSARAGDTKAAVDYAWAALDRGAASAEPFVILARVAERDKRHLDAIANAERAIDIEPNHGEARAVLARAFEAVDLHSEAAQTWREVAAAANNAIGSLRLAVRNDLRAENWPGVLRTCEMALAIDANDPGFFDLRLKALQALKRWPDVKRLTLELVDADIEKAFASLYALAKTEDWRQAVAIMSLLTAQQLRVGAGARVRPYLTVHLRRLALAEQQANQGDEARRLTELADRVDKGF